MFYRRPPSGTDLLVKYLRYGGDDPETSVPVSFRVPESVSLEAEEMAKEFNVSKSQLLRDCLAAGFSDLRDAWQEAVEKGEERERKQGTGS